MYHQLILEVPICLKLKRLKLNFTYENVNKEYATRSKTMDICH